MHATLTVQSRLTSVLGLLGRKEGKNGKGQPGIAAGTRPTDSANDLPPGTPNSIPELEFATVRNRVGIRQARQVFPVNGVVVPQKHHHSAALVRIAAIRGDQ